MLDLFGRPGERRHFVHKRIGRAIGGFVSSGFNPLAAAGGFLSSPERGRPSAAPVAAQLQRGSVALHTGHGHQAAIQNVLSGRATSGFHFDRLTGLIAESGAPSAGGGRCLIPFQKPNPFTGECEFFAGAQPGPEPGGVGGGQATVGRYGVAMVPDVESRMHLGCLPGMVLGKDDLCYNKRDLKNRERKYPKGTPPLLTGGERRCIRKAKTAAGKVARTVVSLQSMGMIPTKKATSRRKKAAVHQIPAVSVVNVE